MPSWSLQRLTVKPPAPDAFETATATPRRVITRQKSHCLRAVPNDHVDIIKIMLCCKDFLAEA